MTGTITDVHETFRRWLGDSYDLDALDAVLCVAAAEQLDGDPPWLLVVSGSGNAKTETVMALAGIGAHIASTITSEGALLSATGKRDRATTATGGLLKAIGGRGLLVLKDFTSIMSMNRDARAAVLGALREVHDGRWVRNVGAEGGLTLTWEGRLVLVGAVTTAWDAAHTVVAAMGDRFVLVRADSAEPKGRRVSGRQAMRNVGDETTMRAELSEAAGSLLGALDLHAGELTDDDIDALLGVADLVTLARTAVERDYQGNVISAHAPEMPTRFAKMLAQIVRGGLAIGMTRADAMRVAVRCAGDSMPPLRLAILADLAAATPFQTRLTDIQRRLQRPRNTVLRELHALQLLGLLVEESDDRAVRFRLDGDVDREALDQLRSRKGRIRI